MTPTTHGARTVIPEPEGRHALARAVSPGPRGSNSPSRSNSPCRSNSPGRSVVLTSALVLALMGCTAVGPDHVPPQVELPDQFDVDPVERTDGEPTPKDPTPPEPASPEPASPEAASPWWSEFDDPGLRDAVERVLDSNLDLAAALARLEQARALYAAQTKARYPQVDATGSATRLELSDVSTGGNAVNISESYALGLEAAWELDFWGRVRRQIEAARGNLDAAAEDVHAVRVSLAGAAALAYVDLRGFEARSDIAVRNVEAQEQTLELVQARFESGLVSQLDVVQSRALLEETRAAIPNLRRGAEAARDQLAVLSGQPPGALDEVLGGLAPVPVVPADISLGAPAELIRRRPDVRAAERRLAAATAEVGVAEAELYPQLQLTGAIGLEATSPGDLFRSGAGVFSFGPSFRWNLFDRRRLRALVGFQEAVVVERLAEYRATVLGAVEDVESAAETLYAEQRRLGALGRAVDDYREAVELSRVRYGQGLVGFQTVLDAQRSLFAAEDALQTSRIEIARSAVELFRAFGGGWPHP